MEDAEPPLLSFGALARQCLEHSDWPRYATPQPRSLAALFSKFDRGLELEWLLDRPDVQHVLSRVLGCPPTSLQRPLGSGVRRGDRETGRWRFQDAPAARPLALRDEGLPPGFPPELSRPNSWNRLEWRARSRAEVGLVAAWLSAQKLALVETSAARLAEGSAQPRFVILPPSEAPAERVPPGCCLATWAAAGSAAQENFSVVRSPPVAQYATELHEWLLARLPSDGSLARVDAAAWLERAEVDGVVDGFEAAVGLLAALDECDRRLALGNWRALFDAFVPRRVARSSVAHRPEARWLEQNASTLLISLFRSLLLDAQLTWDEARPFERWIELMPREYQREVNPEWARAVLSRAGGALSRSELEGALAQVPPGAFELARCLEAVGLLRGIDRAELGPRWACLWAQQGVRDLLLRGPPEQWGEALLSPSLSSAMRSRLAVRLRRDEIDLLEAVIDSDAKDESAPLVLAIETVFELTGLALCAGEEFDTEQLLQLWRRQLRLVIVLEDVSGTRPFPLPRLHSTPSSAERYGAWLSAAWAIAEQLDLPRDESLLDPWGAPERVDSSQLHAVLAMLTACSDDGQVLGVLRLLSRLLDPVTVTLADPLAAIATLLRAPSWSAWELASGAPRCLSAVLQSEDAAHLASSAWSLWVNAGCPVGEHLIDPHHPVSHELWKRVPAATLRELGSRDHAYLARIPYALLPKGSFDVLLDGTRPPPLAAIEHLPTSSVPRALLVCASSSELARELFVHHETALLDAVERAVDAGEELPYEALLRSAPQACQALLSILEARLAGRGLSDPLTRAARGWLQLVSASHGPLRLRAYALLSELERRARRARAAEGRAPL